MADEIIIEVDASAEALLVEVSAGDPPVIEVDVGGGGVTAHSALSGLDADDHTQYALADGTRGDFEASGAASTAVTNHNANTTNVHGIPDTADLIVEGDARLTDSRDPNLHASTHSTGMSDPVTVDSGQVSDFDDAATDAVGVNLIAGSGRITIDHDDVAHTITVDSPEVSEVAVNDTDYVVTTEQLVRFVALSAVRTVTLPEADSVDPGYTIRVTDESGAANQMNFIDVTVPVGDQISNPVDVAELEHAYIKGEFDTIEVQSDGVSQWVLRYPGVRRPYLWWRHLNPIAIVPDQWTPLVWNEPTSDDFRISPGLQSITTAVAASMDTLVLPQTEIEVDSTDGFPEEGWLVITGPPGAGVDTVVSYTGLAAGPPRFTGTDPGNTISTGTLATGQTVTAANVEFDLSARGYLWNTVASVAMDNIDIGEWWGMRYAQDDGGFLLPVTESNMAGVNKTAQHGQCVMQPGSNLGVTTRILIRHSCPSVRNVAVNGVQSPILMGAFMSTF